MGWIRLLSALLAVMWLATGTAQAHGVGGARFEAPLPLWLLYLGAGLTVAVTAVWLSFTPPPSRRLTGTQPAITIQPAVGRGMRHLAGAGFILLTVVALGHGLLGRQVPAENLATLFVWAIWLKGIAILAVLIGTPWRALSPWERVYDGLVWLEGQQVQISEGYPSWLGVWPAVGGFLIGVGILENLTLAPRSPALTSAIVAGYALVMILGGVWFGREWFLKADALSVLYRLLGRVAPLSVERTSAGGYRVFLRAPWRGCQQAVPDWSMAVFVIGIVYTVTFDGTTSTPEYQSLIHWLGAVPGPTSNVEFGLYVAGCSLFIGSYLVVSVLVEWFGAGSNRDWVDAGRAFVQTTLPIAAAYEVAHNYAFVLAQMGATASVIGVGSGEWLGWLSLPVFWGSQVVLIVGGHIAAVIAAHHVAVRRYGSNAAARGHLPLVVLMVGYTMLSLWIISRPIVT